MRMADGVLSGGGWKLFGLIFLFSTFRWTDCCTLVMSESSRLFTRHGGIFFSKPDSYVVFAVV